MDSAFPKGLIRGLLNQLPFWNLYRPKALVESNDVVGGQGGSLLWSEQGRKLLLPDPVVNRPEYFADLSKRRERRTKDQFVIQLRNACIWGTNGAVVTENGEFIKDLSREFGSHGDPTLHSIFRKLHISRPRNLSGTSAVVATAGADVYYHWMLDILPRILILKELALDAEIDRYIINYSGKGFQAETLRMIGFPFEKMLIPEHGSEFHVCAERLLVPSLPSDLSRVNGRECKLLLKHLALFSACESPVGSPQRIYVSRLRAGNRMVENEGEVFSFLEKLGFVKLEMEDYSVSAQMRIFADARIIIGPHGSAFTNIVFCRPGACLVDLLPETNVVSCFFDIATQMGLRYFGFVDSAVIDGRSSMHDSIHIDVAAFETFLADCVLQN